MAATAPDRAIFLKRPLLSLLPFFMAGIALGPELAWYQVKIWPAAGLASIILAWGATTRRHLGLVPLGLVFALIGAASAAAVFIPPEQAAHVHNMRNRFLVFGGRVVEPPQVTYGRIRVLVDIEEYLEMGGQSMAAAGKVAITIPGDRPTVAAGDRVRFPGELKGLSGFGNPGGYDYPRHHIGHGVWASVFLKDSRLMTIIEEPERGFSLKYAFTNLQARATRFLEQTLEQPALGLMKALLLGRMDGIEPDVQEAFRTLGLSHILSISGLHIGLVAWLAYSLIRWLLLRIPDLALRIDVRKTAALMAMGPVLVYTGLAGGSPAITRSAIMVGVYLLAQLVDRFKDLLTALAVAAWAILLSSPAALFTPSFQLSFAATGAIIVLAPRFPWSPFRWPVHTENQQVSPEPVSQLWGLAITTLAATMGTAPIVVYHFHRFPLLSLPANMIFTPVINLLFVPPGLAALAMASLWPAGAALALRGLEMAWWLILPGMQYMAACPGINPWLPTPGLAFFVFFYGLLAAVFLIRPWHRALAWGGGLTMAYFIVTAVPYLIHLNDPQLRITFLDVGQGAAAHVRFPDRSHLVVDGGGFPGADFDPGAELIGPYLLERGLTRLDFLALSHPQTDHAGGLAFLAREFSPRELWSNGATGEIEAVRRLLAAVQAGGIRQPELADLHQWRNFGPARIKALWPLPGFARPAAGLVSSHLENNNSLVLKVEIGNTAFLFPGDLEADGETRLVALYGQGLKADVLMAPHHGSAHSCTSTFLEAVRPAIVVFSVGKDNRYGFPASATLSRVRMIGAQIYRTDLDGAVFMTTDGNRIEVQTYKKGEIN